MNSRTMTVLALLGFMASHAAIKECFQYFKQQVEWINHGSTTMTGRFGTALILLTVRCSLSRN
jgi:hypothetical protein